MKKIIFFLFFPILLFSQVSTNKNIWFAKEFSKELAMYKAKTFLIKEVLDIKEDVSKFEIIPLAASTSGELTTLIYKSSEKEGLILGFFGDYWNDAGVVYQGYKFLNLNRNDATQFLKKINDTLEENDKYLKNDIDNNNIFFSFKDIDILINYTGKGYSIRLYFENFDSSWDETAFTRSKRRFEKNFKN